MAPQEGMICQMELPVLPLQFSLGSHYEWSYLTRTKDQLVDELTLEQVHSEENP